MDFMGLMAFCIAFAWIPLMAIVALIFTVADALTKFIRGRFRI